MLGRAVLIAAISASCLPAGSPTTSGVKPDWRRMTQDACGSRPQARCLTELRTICHEHPPFRCHDGRRDRMDAIRWVGFPAQSGA